MRKVYDFLIKFLVHQPLKAASYVLSHGGFHLILLAVVITFTYYWYNYNIHSSDVTMHNISMGVDSGDTFAGLAVNIKIDSDSIRKETNGKFGSSVDFRFTRQIMDKDENGNSRDPSTVSVSVYGIPDLVVDSLLEGKYKISQRVDSTIEIELDPLQFGYKRPDGSIRRGAENLTFYSNDLGLKKGESSYNYFFHFGWLPEIHETRGTYGPSYIWIQFGDETMKNAFLFYDNKKLLYNYIYPEPDILNNGFILYNTDEKIDEVRKNHGIIIQAEEIDAANNDNRKALIYSVWVGTLIAFAIDIAVQLVREWRNVNRKDDEDKKKRMENDIVEKKHEEAHSEANQQKTNEAVDNSEKNA